MSSSDDTERMEKLLAYTKQPKTDEDSKNFKNNNPYSQLTQSSFHHIYADTLSVKESENFYSEDEQRIDEAKEIFDQISETHAQMMDLHRQLESAYLQLQKE